MNGVRGVFELYETINTVYDAFTNPISTVCDALTKPSDSGYTYGEQIGRIGVIVGGVFTGYSTTLILVGRVAIGGSCLPVGVMLILGFGLVWLLTSHMKHNVSCKEVTVAMKAEGEALEQATDEIQEKTQELLTATTEAAHGIQSATDVLHGVSDRAEALGVVVERLIEASDRKIEVQTTTNELLKGLAKKREFHDSPALKNLMQERAELIKRLDVAENEELFELDARLDAIAQQISDLKKG